LKAKGKKQTAKGKNFYVLLLFAVWVLLFKSNGKKQKILTCFFLFAFWGLLFLPEFHPQRVLKIANRQ
jgi:hypothetical protein